VTTPATRPATTEYPVMRRTGYKFLRRMAALGTAIFSGIGKRAYFLFAALGAMWREPRTYFPLIFRFMRSIGVDSFVLIAIVAAFIGSVIALQTRYQLFPGVQLSVVGLIVRQSIVLELGPLLTGLVLTGRVGARMTAEIGTMRVTEQIDALETLAYDPMAYLIVPRLIAATLMLPILLIFANIIGVTIAFFTAVLATDVTWADFQSGLRIAFNLFQIFYSLLKATIFGGAIAFFCSYEGYVADVGAEGVGRSTARAVVMTSVAILVLDAFIAALFAPRLQG
jgi:phospholipid/cholesterol/gamma-HCH transport system permease protein